MRLGPMRARARAGRKKANLSAQRQQKRVCSPANSRFAERRLGPTRKDLTNKRIATPRSQQSLHKGCPVRSGLTRRATPAQGLADEGAPQWSEPGLSRPSAEISQGGPK